MIIRLLIPFYIFSDVSISLPITLYLPVLCNVPGGHIAWLSNMHT